MSDTAVPFRNPNPYIPGTLSEIYDFLPSFLGGVPGFVDDSGWFPDRSIDSEFFKLVSSFALVRKKVGEERYARLMDLTARAKALFLDDPEDDNGKTDQGVALIHEIEGIIQEARGRRVKQKLADDEGEVTGD